MVLGWGRGGGSGVDLPMTEQGLHSQGQRLRTKPPWAWLHFPTAVTRGKRLSLCLLTSKMGTTKSVYCADGGFSVFVNTPQFPKVVLTAQENGERHRRTLRSLQLFCTFRTYQKKSSIYQKKKEKKYMYNLSHRRDGVNKSLCKRP